MPAGPGARGGERSAPPHRRPARTVDGVPDERSESRLLLDQLRSTLERLTTLAGRTPDLAQSAAQMLGVPAVPAPGRLAAEQVAAVAGAVRAQRSSVAALRASLDAFEQQLAVLEELLEPLESLSRTWASVEHRLTGWAGRPG